MAEAPDLDPVFNLMTVRFEVVLRRTQAAAQRRRHSAAAQPVSSVRPQFAQKYRTTPAPPPTTRGARAGDVDTVADHC